MGESNSINMYEGYWNNRKGNVSLRNPFWLPVDLARGHPGADFRAVVSKCGNCYLKPQEERVSAKPKMPVKGPGY
jgi:hypothetical protein